MMSTLVVDSGLCRSTKDPTCHDGSENGGFGIAHKLSEGKRSSSGKDKRSSALRRSYVNDNTSPVLGLRILPAEELCKVPENMSIASDKKFACKLCRMAYVDPFELANHRCVRIESVRYSCPECRKSFSCPANLASHRRWHKPKIDSTNSCRLKDVDERIGPKAGKIRTVARHASKKLDGCTTTSHNLVGQHHSKGKLSNRCSLYRKDSKRVSYLSQQQTTRKNDASSASKLSSPQKPGDGENFFCSNDFCGLAALAFAAEMHSSLLHRPKTTHQAEEARNSSARCYSSGHVIEKASMGLRNAERGGCAETLEKFSRRSTPWFPPSPPASDSSCSPHSMMSDDNVGKILADWLSVAQNGFANHCINI